VDSLPRLLQQIRESFKIEEEWDRPDGWKRLNREYFMALIQEGDFSKPLPFPSVGVANPVTAVGAK
jgi:hypothetical protein